MTSGVWSSVLKITAICFYSVSFVFYAVNLDIHCLDLILDVEKSYIGSLFWNWIKLLCICAVR